MSDAETYLSILTVLALFLVVCAWRALVHASRSYRLMDMTDEEYEEWEQRGKRWPWYLK